MNNQKRKAKQAEDMFSQMIEKMNEAHGIDRGQKFATETEIPAWL